MNSNQAKTTYRFTSNHNTLRKPGIGIGTGTIRTVLESCNIVGASELESATNSVFLTKRELPESPNRS